MRIGARIWKTALAVAAAIAVSRLIGLDTPVFAGIAAIICMQPTIAGSLRKGVERMQATIIGAGFSLLALIIIDAFPILLAVRPAIVGLTVLVVMVVTIRLGWMDSLVLAAATVVVIMVLPPDENIYTYSASRTVVTFIGIVVATAVNAVFITPRYSGPLWANIDKLVHETNQVYRRAVEAFCRREISLVTESRKSLEESEELFRNVSTTMEWMEEEAQLRRKVARAYGSDVEMLSRMVELLASIRTSTETILRVTEDMLNRTPEYADHHAHAYDILWKLAHVSFRIFDRIENRLTGTDKTLSEDAPMWTEELHKQLISGLRSAYTAPRDVFPLVEVAVVAFEIRRVTEHLSELDGLIERSSPTPH